MKKLLFVLAFAFIGQQAFSQMYIVTVDNINSDHPHYSSCNFYSYDVVMTTISPTGSLNYQCLLYSGNLSFNGNSIALLNQEFNSILSQWYKLVGIDADNEITTSTAINDTWYFAIPWSASGLEEVPTTLKSFFISPNPANTFVDVSLDYSLKGESEVVFISEAGYISHKESIGNISKNEKYNIDISKIPAGKYLVTIVNGKTYTTPQKLIVF